MCVHLVQKEAQQQKAGRGGAWRPQPLPLKKPGEGLLSRAQQIAGTGWVLGGLCETSSPPERPDSVPPSPSLQLCSPKGRESGGALGEHRESRSLCPEPGPPSWGSLGLFGGTSHAPFLHAEQRGGGRPLKVKPRGGFEAPFSYGPETLEPPTPPRRACALQEQTPAPLGAAARPPALGRFPLRQAAAAANQTAVAEARRTQAGPSRPVTLSSVPEGRG